MERQSQNLWRVVALAVFLAFPVVSCADDEVDPQAPDDEENPGAVIEQSMIDQLVFQELRRVHGVRIRINGIAITARDQIDSKLKDILDELERTCQLSEVQKQKLTLGGRGDIRRFFDQVAELRRKYPAKRIDPMQLEQIWPEISPVQEQFTRGLFGDDSLFAKTLRKTLTEDQQARYQAALLDRRRAGYGAAIEKVLEKYQASFRSVQLQALQQLLVEETQPPLLYGEHDHRVVMLRIGELPTTKLKTFLNKDQLKFLRTQWLDASGYEDYLVMQGAIEPKRQTAPIILRSVRTVVEAKPE